MSGTDIEKGYLGCRRVTQPAPNSGCSTAGSLILQSFNLRNEAPENVRQLGDINFRKVCKWRSAGSYGGRSREPFSDERSLLIGEPSLSPRTTPRQPCPLSSRAISRPRISLWPSSLVPTVNIAVVDCIACCRRIQRPRIEHHEWILWLRRGVRLPATNRTEQHLQGG